METSTIQVIVSDNGDQATVICGETVTIENSVAFKQALSDALEASRLVALDSRKLQEVDITALQLVCSACKSASSRGSTLFFENGVPGCYETLRTVIGANYFHHCSHTESCIWGGGNKPCQN